MKLCFSRWARRSVADDDPGHSEIQELLGAYALDAVDDRERALIEAHLETCESCRAELDDHRRLVETLRQHGATVSPLAGPGANGSRNGVVPPAARASGRAVPVAFVVAIAVLAVTLAGIFVQGQVRFDHLDATAARIELTERALVAATDPAAVVTVLRSPAGDALLSVVSRADGGASFAIDSALRSPADDGTYQLWSDDDGTVTAAAALGRDRDVVMFSSPPGVTDFLVTIEHNPIPSKPTLPAVATGQVTP